MSEEWGDAGRVAEYLSREIPHRATAEEMLLEALPSRVKRLFAEVHALLTPGGVFANLDLVASASSRLHERFRREIGRTQDDPTDRLADHTAQMSWLREAGFAEVDCHFKWLEMTLVIAVKKG